MPLRGAGDTEKQQSQGTTPRGRRAARQVEGTLSIPGFAGRVGYIGRVSTFGRDFGVAVEVQAPDATLEQLDALASALQQWMLKKHRELELAYMAQSGK